MNSLSEQARAKALDVYGRWMQAHAFPAPHRLTPPETTLVDASIAATLELVEQEARRWAEDAKGTNDREAWAADYAYRSLADFCRQQREGT